MLLIINSLDRPCTSRDFFDDEGQAGTGAIEQVGNLSSEEIIEYTNSDRIANGLEIFRFYEPNLDVFFNTTSVAERDNFAENFPNYQLEGDIESGGVTFYVPEAEI